jgi:hypothetical protein
MSLTDHLDSAWGRSKNAGTKKKKICDYYIVQLTGAQWLSFLAKWKWNMALMYYYEQAQSSWLPIEMTNSSLLLSTDSDIQDGPLSIRKPCQSTFLGRIIWACKPPCCVSVFGTSKEIEDKMGLLRSIYFPKVVRFLLTETGSLFPN